MPLLLGSCGPPTWAFAAMLIAVLALTSGGWQVMKWSFEGASRPVTQPLAGRIKRVAWTVLLFAAAVILLLALLAAVNLIVLLLR